ncbi:DUF6580 family putative transport protein [Candidatus Omnitrophota bacterium]
MLALSLILIGILLRFVPHAPNFTPVAAIALFSGVYLKKKYFLVVPLLLMIASDFFIGMHNVVIFTWGGFVLVALLGPWVRKHKSGFRVFSAAVASSLIFYLVSNFGVWLMGWYPRTIDGLISCYVMGIPFIRNFTLATVMYSAIFFGAYDLIASKVRETKLAKVLLTE